MNLKVINSSKGNSLLNEFVLGSGFLKQKIDFQGGEGNAVFITSLSFSCWFDQQKKVTKLTFSSQKANRRIALIMQNWLIMKLIGDWSFW